MQCVQTQSRLPQRGAPHTSLVPAKAFLTNCRASPRQQCRARQDICERSLRTAATATATAALTTVSHKQQSEAHDAYDTPKVSYDPWLHQAIPGLVRQLSGHAAGCLQLISEPLPGHCAFTYKQLDSSQSQSQQAWSSILSSCSPATTAVILARPIPDPSQVCLLCQPPTGTSDTTTTSTGCTNTGSTLQLQGSVDIDSCCSDSNATSAATLTDSQHTHSQHDHDRTLHASMQARARELVVSPVQIMDTQSSSSSSGSEEEAAAPQAPAHKHTPRSRRRFLRRQQAAKVAAASGTAPATKEPFTSYFGLAVQSLQPTSAVDSQGSLNGCYVLKLSRNSDVTGCTCTMFSLTRVCSGQALHSQLQQSWLVQ